MGGDGYSVGNRLLKCGEIWNTAMSKKIILKALNSALSLLNDEYETVIHADLRERYDEAIGEIEKAIKAIESK